MKILKRLVICTLLIASCICLWLAYKEYKPIEESKTNLKAIKEVAVTQEEGEESPIDRVIDFDSLQRINPDIIGWLYVPDADLDFPILKGSYDEEYLYKDFDGSYNPVGSVFTWAESNPSLTDEYVYLFAHNMGYGMMFGKLFDLKPSIDTETCLAYVYTPERSREYKLEKYYTCVCSDAIFQGDVETDYQQLVLATCDGYAYTPNRFVVQGTVNREKVILN